jgi:hypothetical protein
MIGRQAVVGDAVGRARHAARRIGRTLRNIFRRKRHVARPPATRALAEFLSNVDGSSLIWCSECSELLTPIIYSDGKQAELVALACLDCQRSIPVSVGVLIDGIPP